MRYQGKIVNWNDEKGYGFVTPNGGGAKTFVHISEIQNKSRRPIDGDLITYEVITAQDGRTKAAHIQFVGEVIKTPRKESNSLIGNVALCLVFGVVAWFGYSQFSAYRHRMELASMPPAEVEPAMLQPHQATTFTCDGRTQCTQMHSCEEAQFFINQCPGTQMDGDHDGKACEDRCGH